MKYALIANGMITDVVDAENKFEIREIENEFFWKLCPDTVENDGTWFYRDGAYVQEVAPPDTYKSRTVERVRQYGPIGMQLDMMYQDMINGTTLWQDHVTAVKNNTLRPGDLVDE